MRKLTSKANSKFHSDAPFTNVDVVFDNEEQLKSLIASLQSLLSEDDVEYVEIEDSESTEYGLGASLYFHRVGFKRDETDVSCIKSAENLIMRHQNS